MSSTYYGNVAGELADRGGADECERCGSPLAADDPNGYDGPFCGPCELDIEDEDEPLGEPDWSGHGHGVGTVGCPECEELDD